MAAANQGPVKAQHFPLMPSPRPPPIALPPLDNAFRSGAANVNVKTFFQVWDLFLKNSDLAKKDEEGIKLGMIHIFKMTFEFFSIPLDDCGDGWRRQVYGFGSRRRRSQSFARSGHIPETSFRHEHFRRENWPQRWAHEEWARLKGQITWTLHLDLQIWRRWAVADPGSSGLKLSGQM